MFVGVLRRDEGLGGEDDKACERAREIQQVMSASKGNVEIGTLPGAHTKRLRKGLQTFVQSPGPLTGKATFQQSNCREMKGETRLSKRRLVDQQRWLSRTMLEVRL